MDQSARCLQSVSGTHVSFRDIPATFLTDCTRATVGNICVHIICSAYKAPRGVQFMYLRQPLRHAGSFTVYLYVKDTYEAHRTKSSKIRMNLLGPRIREYLSEHGWKVSIYASYFMHENLNIIG